MGTAGLRAMPSYEFTSERQIMCFVDTGVLMGETFDTNPHLRWAQVLLGNRALSADQRASALLDAAVRLRQYELEVVACVPEEQRSSMYVLIDEESVEF
jgi:hypothetical protein